MKKICKNCKYYVPRRKPMTCCYDDKGYCNKDGLDLVGENYTCEKFKEKEEE